FASTLTATIGRSHEDEGLIDDEGLFGAVQRNALRRQTELLDEPGRVTRRAGEIDQERRGCRDDAHSSPSFDSSYANRDASSLILSGRKPDQWSSSVTTTGACM